MTQYGPEGTKNDVVVGMQSDSFNSTPKRANDDWSVVDFRRRPDSEAYLKIHPPQKHLNFDWIKLNPKIRSL